MNLRSFLKSLIPPRLQPFAARAYHQAVVVPFGAARSLYRKARVELLDLVEAPTRDPLLPPRSLMFVGTGDFVRVGDDLKDKLVRLGGLQASDRVLDAGSGVGRVAVPLTRYLSSDGEYWGFDIVKSGVDWCEQHISSRFPNFHFVHCDVYNELYWPQGRIQPKDFRFPFDDASFDFVFLTSVFTHMLPADVENYTHEISRVLRQGGKCLITFFLLNSESLELVRRGLSTQDFKYGLKGCMTTHANTPEAAIGYPEAWVWELFHRHGLSIAQAVQYGSWCGRAGTESYQDILVARKS